MPRKLRIPKVRRWEFGEKHKTQLFTGHDMFLDAFREDLAAMRETWIERREELLAEFIARNPGSRPWAWWIWEAPQARRRRLGGTGTALAGTERTWMGTPGGYQADYAVTDPPAYETELKFLQRHGLLSSSELRALAAGGCP